MVDHAVTRHGGRGADRWVRALAAACLLLTTVACGGQPHPTLEELRKVPEVSLHPPGAIAIRHGGADSDSKMGDNAAILTDVYATDDSPAAVFDYYRNHLGPGWTENDNAGTRATQWADSAAWESDAYRLKIGIDDHAYLSRVAAGNPEVAGKRTLFELQLQANPENDS